MFCRFCRSLNQIYVKIKCSSASFSVWVQCLWISIYLEIKFSIYHYKLCIKLRVKAPFALNYFQCIDVRTEWKVDSVFPQLCSSFSCIKMESLSNCPSASTIPTNENIECPLSIVHWFIIIVSFIFNILKRWWYWHKHKWLLPSFPLPMLFLVEFLVQSSCVELLI